MTSPEPYIVRRGTGNPLLFIHGNGVDHRLLADLDDVFGAEPGWERIYIDLPGFGGTPALSGRGGLPDVANWLDQTVAMLIGSSPFAVVGNSMGGLLARNLVAQRMGASLGFALLAPIVDPVRANRTVPQAAVLREDHDLLASLDPSDADAYSEMAVVQSANNWEKFRAAALPGIRAADSEAMRKIADLYELPTFRETDLNGFTRPVSIITGRQDAVVGYKDQEELSQQYVHATCAALDRAGHNVHLDQPRIVRELLREWSQRANMHAK